MPYLSCTKSADEPVECLFTNVQQVTIKPVITAAVVPGTRQEPHLIGPKLPARSLPAQRGEVAIAVAALNKMIRTAKPVSVRVA